MEQPEIPEDVRKAAEAVWTSAFRTTATHIDIIARAIMAERERCAKVAEALVMLATDNANIPFDREVEAERKGRSGAARHIFNAIRKGVPHGDG